MMFVYLPLIMYFQNLCDLWLLLLVLIVLRIMIWSQIIIVLCFRHFLAGEVSVKMSIYLELLLLI